MIFDFKDKKIVVMGLGLNNGGVGVAKFFAKNQARVVVTDLKSKDELKKPLKELKKFSNIEYHFGAHIEDDFKNADLIIKNPAIPYTNKFIEIAKKNNVLVKTDISLFFDFCPGEVIGVTGTKGKSTVATLIYKLLKDSYKDTILAGNIGVSPLDFLSKIKKTTKIVLELSSFSLEELKKSPKIAVITSILPDHLDRYRSMNSYISAKKTILKYQNKEDFLVLNYDYSEIKKMVKGAKAKVYFYSTKIKKSKQREFCQIEGGVIRCGEKICNISDLKVYGSENLSNVLAAITVAKILNIPSLKIKKVIKQFKGVSYRQEFVREVSGVKYFNDTTATMPEASISAIKTFKTRFPKANLIFICGGVNKGLNFENLKKEIKKNVNTLILLPGSASDKIGQNLRMKNILFSSSMNEAVKKAKSIAKRGDIVVLSPGAASFNLFKNEFDRGSKFVASVKRLK